MESMGARTEPKTRTGRPTRAGKVAARLVTLRLTDAEYARFKRAAGKATLAEWIRTACATALAVGAQ
jgi:hypothetical protein